MCEQVGTWQGIEITACKGIPQGRFYWPNLLAELEEDIEVWEPGQFTPFLPDGSLDPALFDDGWVIVGALTGEIQ